MVKHQAFFITGVISYFFQFFYFHSFIINSYTVKLKYRYKQGHQTLFLSEYLWWVIYREIIWRGYG